KRLLKAVRGKVTVIPGGPAICRRIGVVTGGAGSELNLAASEGVDTFVTGEGPHWTYALAEELGVNVLYGGHYATETFGVKALAAEVSKRFKIPWTFVDHPTGLRSEEHTSELQSRFDLVCRLLLEKKKSHN